MISTKTFFLLILLGLPALGQAANLQEVIDGYIAAQGGEEAIATVKALRIEGTIRQPDGQELPFIQFKKVPNLMRATVELPQGELITGYDGKVAWLKSRAMEQALEMSPEASASTAASAPLFSQLYLLREQPKRLLLLGTADVDGEPCYEIQARPDSGQDVIFFVSTKTFLEKKVVVVADKGGTLSRTEVVFSDERSVPPLTIPFVVTTYQNGALSNEIVIEKATVNPGVYNSYFSPPGGLMKNPPDKHQAAPPAKRQGTDPGASDAVISKPILSTEEVRFLDDSTEQGEGN